MEAAEEYSIQAGSPASTFPKSLTEFEADPRVSFSKLERRWILEAEDGSEFEYDEALKRWVPVVSVQDPHA